MNFTKEELYWIERTADIESSLAIDKFIRLCNTPLDNKSTKEKDELKRIGSELIDLHIFLKELRSKLELRRKEQKTIGDNKEGGQE